MGKPAEDEFSVEMVMARLRQHLNEQRPVTLYNTYEGVPISYEAEVAMVHPDYIGLIVHPYQSVCIKEERRTYLGSVLIPTIVRAYPVSIDYTNNVVMLKRFKIPKSISVDLFNAWIAPEKTVAVNIGSDFEEDFSSQLLEIAVLEGNRIRVAVKVPKDPPFMRQDDVELSFKLQPGGEVLQVQGVVQSVKKIRGKEYKRMEVEGSAGMNDEITILAFIATREDQIMGVLDRAFQKLRKGKNRKKR